MTQRLTATVTQEGALYVARCLEVEVASQGDSVEEALRNLKEAVELFFEVQTSPVMHQAPLIAHLDVEVP